MPPCLLLPGRVDGILGLGVAMPHYVERSLGQNGRNSNQSGMYAYLSGRCILQSAWLERYVERVMQ